MKIWLFALFCLFSTACWAETVDTYAFKNEADRTRAVALAKTLRCVQCQNQNLVESNSQAAFQLRTEVYQMVEAGQSDEQIKQQLVARFGDFVLYQPPLNWKTYALWGVPPVLLLLALWWAWRYRQYSRLNAMQAVGNTEKFANFSPLTLSGSSPRKQGEQKLSVYAKSKGLTLAVWVLVFGVPLGYYALSGRFQQVQRAEDDFQQAMQARAAQDRFERKETLVEALQNRLRQNPNDGQSWFELGQAYMQNNEFDNALESYSRASLLLGKKPMILGAVASAEYYQAHQRVTPQVQSWIEEALSQDPNESASLAILAAEAFKRGNYDQALARWQQILDSGRTDIERRAIIQAMENTDRLKTLK